MAVMTRKRATYLSGKDWQGFCDHLAVYFLSVVILFSNPLDYRTPLVASSHESRRHLGRAQSTGSKHVLAG